MTLDQAAALVARYANDPEAGAGWTGGDLLWEAGIVHRPSVVRAMTDAIDNLARAFVKVEGARPSQEDLILGTRDILCRLGRAAAILRAAPFADHP